MRKLVIGFFIGVFFCVSLFESIHLTIERDTIGFCSIFYDSLSDKWNPYITDRLKLTYKLFAYPVKTIHLYFEQSGMVRVGDSKTSTELFIDPRNTKTSMD